MKTVAAYDRKKEIIERIERAQAGIDASAEVISEMLCERGSEDCREWAKNDYLVGGMLGAIGLLSDYSSSHIYELKNLLDKKEKKAAKIRKSPVGRSMSV